VLLLGDCISSTAPHLEHLPAHQIVRGEGGDAVHPMTNWRRGDLLGVLAPDLSRPIPSRNATPAVDRRLGLP
jgi:hypothetical protein